MHEVARQVMHRPRMRSKAHAKVAEAHGGASDLTTGLGTPKRYFRLKHWPVRCFACLLLAIGSPILLGIMLLVRLTSRGPAIYRQTRVGMRGRVFTMYKLRTMRQDAESGTGAVWAQIGNDPRVTPVGRVMRRLHLDELPQLINVIKGEMALIGPRPERPEFTQMLAVKIPGYMERHSVRPGITGLAQLHLPPDSHLDDVRRKLKVDLEYIQTANIGLDLRIFLVTFLRMVGLRNRFPISLIPLKTNLFEEKDSVSFAMNYVEAETI